MPPASAPETPGAAAVPGQDPVRLAGQLSINDVLLELGQAPVVDPDPDADAGDTNFF